jgi:hypothetical protein
MFKQSVIEKLGFYVYFLQDPRTEEIFYVGKGFGNRVFNHVEGALDKDNETEKLDKIRSIVNSGNTVKHYILRHGLTKEASFEIEAALIDFIGMKNLSNLQGGHNSSDYGLKTSDEITSMYSAEELRSDKPILLININKRYHREITDEELYDATRKSWVVGSRKENAQYAVATYRGLTREVYVIDEWYPVVVNGKTRWGFNGCRAEDELRKELRYKSISSYFPKGAANPIKYLNC